MFKPNTQSSIKKNQKRIDWCDDKTKACNEIDHGRDQDSPWLSSGSAVDELGIHRG